MVRRPRSFRGSDIERAAGECGDRASWPARGPSRTIEWRSPASCRRRRERRRPSASAWISSRQVPSGSQVPAGVGAGPGREGGGGMMAGPGCDGAFAGSGGDGGFAIVAARAAGSSRARGPISASVVSRSASWVGRGQSPLSGRRRRRAAGSKAGRHDGRHGRTSGASSSGADTQLGASSVDGADARIRLVQETCLLGHVEISFQTSLQDSNERRAR